jgi:hypothetical protein
MMLSIILITPLIAASAVPPYLIMAIQVFWKSKTLRERFHDERIRPQFFKSLRSENDAVQKSCRERGGAQTPLDY